MAQELLTIDEAADWLRVSVRTIHNMLNRKEIIGVKIGNRWRFRKAALEEYILNLEEAQKHEVDALAQAGP